MVFEQYRSHLTHLVGFCIVTAALQIDFLFNADSTKDVMAATDTLHKTKAREQRAEIVKTNGCVGSAAEHAPQSPFCSHKSILI